MSKDLIRVLTVVVVLAILVSGGLLVYRKVNNSKTVILPINQKSQSLNIGEKLVIELPSNPSTGYSWVLDNNYDKNVVNLVSQKYLPPVGDNAIGAAGSEEWTFVGVSKGQTDIVMNYLRPWEQNTSPAVSKNYIITVN